MAAARRPCRESPRIWPPAAERVHIVQYFPGVIPPEGYGGIERMVFWLTRELARRGLRVTLMANPRSRITEALPGVRLVPTDGWTDFRTLIPQDADLIHLHA